MFMFTQISFRFGAIHLNLLNITTYKLPDGNGTGSYSYISCNLVCGRVNHRDSAWSIVTATAHAYTFAPSGVTATPPGDFTGIVAVTLLVLVLITETVLLFIRHIYIFSIWCDYNSIRRFPYKHIGL